MKFVRAYVRATPLTTPVPSRQIDQLSKYLSETPAEIEFRATAAYRHGRRLPGVETIAPALARRFVVSLLAREPNEKNVRTALGLALTAPPDDAEEALTEAGLEVNLRLSLYATDDAKLRMEGATLIIEDGHPASQTLTMEQVRDAGRRVFCTEALARLVGNGFQRVVYSPTAILPLTMQLEPGALMEPDVAQRAVRKGDWRATQKLVFAKEFCIACGRCFVHCPDNAIRHAMFDKSAADRTGILGVDYDRCTACGLCVSVCPTDKSGYRALAMIGADEEPSRGAHRVA